MGVSDVRWDEQVNSTLLAVLGRDRVARTYQKVMKKRDKARHVVIARPETRFGGDRGVDWEVTAGIGPGHLPRHLQLSP